MLPPPGLASIPRLWYRLRSSLHFFTFQTWMWKNKYTHTHTHTQLYNSTFIHKGCNTSNSFSSIESNWLPFSFLFFLYILICVGSVCPWSSVILLSAYTGKYMHILKNWRVWKSHNLFIFKMVVIWGMLFFIRNTERKSINYISK